MARLTPERGLILGALIFGLVIRWLLRGFTTHDAVVYLLPWYRFAHDHGLDALGFAFTNYTPAYSYLLLLATALDALARPLTLIKTISWCVELINAVLAHRVVSVAGGGARRAAFAFAAVWLAPTVLFNGAAFGQIDALWCAFILLAVLMFLRGRDGTWAFGAAFAMKAQGVFLGPFVLGQILGRRINGWGLAWIPALYLLIAAPVLAAGRSLTGVLDVYLAQADTFHHLSMNAANVWAILARVVPYDVGVPVGLGLAAVGGAALAWRIARIDLDRPLALLTAAAASLILTPYLLPKMHDRYFYAFEVMALILACLDRRWRWIALAAQGSGVIAYLDYGGPILPPGIIGAAIVNTVLLGLVLLRLEAFTLRKPRAAEARAVAPQQT